MAPYRKKPVVIDAVQWHKAGDHPAVRELTDVQEPVGERGRYYVETLEGPLRVSPGDWIICGVKGEHYPCKPDVFAATYDPVSSDQ
jgi:hypothetical protein